MNLNEKEIQNRERLLKEWGYGSDELWADIEESAEGSRSYYYKVYPSGIGDRIDLCYKDKSADITDYDSF